MYRRVKGIVVQGQCRKQENVSRLILTLPPPACTTTNDYPSKCQYTFALLITYYRYTVYITQNVESKNRKIAGDRDRRIVQKIGNSNRQKDCTLYELKRRYFVYTYIIICLTRIILCVIIIIQKITNYSSVTCSIGRTYNTVEDII